MSFRFALRLLGMATACFALTSTIAKPAHAESTHTDDRVDFNREVRSLLSDKCFLCHGPDEGTREAGLRLDDREQAIDLSAIVPGSPEESELIARITSEDPDLVMPPPETGKKVTAEEAETLARWIQQDAPYDKHWAFVVPQRPDLPLVKNQV